MATKNKCSDGSYVSINTIRLRYMQSREEKYFGLSSNTLCECCQQQPGNDSDHTIAQARCKQIHKTELIWDNRNYVWSCRACHRQWENFKSGEWLYHKNVEERLLFLKMHDPEGYRIRINLTIT